MHSLTVSGQMRPATVAVKRDPNEDFSMIMVYVGSSECAKIRRLASDSVHQAHLSVSPCLNF